ncbi:MAG: cell division protein FtsZ, partial [Gammaproteobacteria bacterium]|nr:cell division protein FtsZ [Gammaproteobacteria bacterium]
EMTSGELRVTLVATGLGSSKKKVVVESEIATPIIKPGKMGKVEYAELDKPIGMRGKKIVGDTIEIPEDKESMEYLEIPAFLRRQAD